jgi:hypothetical protein
MSPTNHPIDSRKDQEKRPARSPHFQEEDRDTLIAELTLRNWERAGRPRGQWEAFWIEAEEQLLAVTFSMYLPGK